MAERRQPLIPRWLLPGVIASLAMLLVAVLALGSLWRHAPQISGASLWHDPYLWHVIRFTFWQALLSALCSVMAAIVLARTLFRRRFPGRQL